MKVLNLIDIFSTRRLMLLQARLKPFSVAAKVLRKFRNNLKKFLNLARFFSAIELYQHLYRVRLKTEWREATDHQKLSLNRVKPIVRDLLYQSVAEQSEFIKDHPYAHYRITDLSQAVTLWPYFHTFGWVLKKCFRQKWAPGELKNYVREARQTLRQEREKLVRALLQRLDYFTTPHQPIDYFQSRVIRGRDHAQLTSSEARVLEKTARIEWISENDFYGWIAFIKKQGNSIQRAELFRLQKRWRKQQRFFLKPLKWWMPHRWLGAYRLRRRLFCWMPQIRAHLLVLKHDKNSIAHSKRWWAVWQAEFRWIQQQKRVRWPSRRRQKLLAQWEAELNQFRKNKIKQQLMAWIDQATQQFGCTAGPQFEEETNSLKKALKSQLPCLKSVTLIFKFITFEQTFDSNADDLIQAAETLFQEAGFSASLGKSWLEKKTKEKISTRVTLADRAILSVTKVLDPKAYEVLLDQAETSAEVQFDQLSRWISGEKPLNPASMHDVLRRARRLGLHSPVHQAALIRLAKSAQSTYSPSNPFPVAVLSVIDPLGSLFANYMFDHGRYLLERNALAQWIQMNGLQPRLLARNPALNAVYRKLLKQYIQKKLEQGDFSNAIDQLKKSEPFLSRKDFNALLLRPFMKGVCASSAVWSSQLQYKMEQGTSSCWVELQKKYRLKWLSSLLTLTDQRDSFFRYASVASDKPVSVREFVQAFGAENFLSVKKQLYLAANDFIKKERAWLSQPKKHLACIFQWLSEPVLLSIDPTGELTQKIAVFSSAYQKAQKNESMIQEWVEQLNDPEKWIDLAKALKSSRKNAEVYQQGGRRSKAELYHQRFERFQPVIKQALIQRSQALVNKQEQRNENWIFARLFLPFLSFDSEEDLLIELGFQQQRWMGWSENSNARRHVLLALSQRSLLLSLFSGVKCARLFEALNEWKKSFFSVDSDPEFDRLFQYYQELQTQISSSCLANEEHIPSKKILKSLEKANATEEFQSIATTLLFWKPFLSAMVCENNETVKRFLQNFHHALQKKQRELEEIESNQKVGSDHFIRCLENLFVDFGIPDAPMVSEQLSSGCSKKKLLTKDLWQQLKKAVIAFSPTSSKQLNFSITDESLDAIRCLPRDEQTEEVESLLLLYARGAFSSFAREQAEQLYRAIAKQPAAMAVSNHLFNAEENQHDTINSRQPIELDRRFGTQH